jgi:hypothetical protein
MATKTKARNQGQNQDQPGDSEIRRAAERIGVIPGNAAAKQNEDAENEWFCGVLLKATDLVGEIRAAHADRDTSRQGFDELLDGYLDQLNAILWSARWDLLFSGGDKRIGLVKGEVAS